MELMNKQQRHL